MNSLYHPVRQRIARAMSFSALQNAADVRRTLGCEVQPSGQRKAACRRAHAIFLKTSRDWRRRTPIKLPG
jgi:hypothetical protein